MSDDLHSAWAALLLRCFASAGVSEVVLSPGSRSTPLALAAVGEAGCRVTTVIDERSAAFFALGQARVTGRPSLLICTSGSAAAHYMPAILEAERADVPLIALTADRPWELSEAGANQTLDQLKLFGSHVRGFFEIGAPEAVALGHLPRIVAQAVLAASDGPVQVNARFRKPLEPVPSAGDEAWRPRFETLLERGAPRVFRADRAPSADAVAHVAELVARAARVLVVAGPLRGVAAPRLRTALAGFLQRSEAVLTAEATSGVRYGPELAGRALGALDAWLPLALERGDAPELAIEIGSPPTSGAWLGLLERLPDLRRVVVSSRGIPDPAGGASDVVLGDAAELFARVSERLDGRAGDRAWTARLSALASRVAAPSAGAELSEPYVVESVVAALPDGAVLVVGNSLPVRDLDLFGGTTRCDVTVLHQRGLSGIDGLFAGAMGARSVTEPGAPVVALVGDVSAQHDIGSLALAASCRAPLAIVVVNNAGGRIFEQLPVARAVPGATLERLFSTPPALELEHVARGFGVEFARCSTRRDFARVVEASLARRGASLIEAVVVPELGRRARMEARA